MGFDVGKLVFEDDVWQVEYPDYYKRDRLENLVDCETIFIAHDGYWEEVYIGPAIFFSGEIGLKKEQYEGPAVKVKCGNSSDGRVKPCPGVEIGQWAACKWFEDGAWPIKPGMLVRQPVGIGEFSAGTYNFAPSGRCVVEVGLGSELGVDWLGNLAFDLAHPPFPQSLRYFDGQTFPDSKLAFSWTPDHARLTEDFFGKVDMDTWFWLY